MISYEEMKRKVKNKVVFLDNQQVDITVNVIEHEIEDRMMANIKTPGLYKNYVNCYWQSDYSERTLNEVVKEIQKAGYNVSLEKEPKIRKRMSLSGDYEQDDVLYTITVRLDEK